MPVKVQMPQVDAISAAVSPVTRWYVLFAMVAVYTLSIADRYVISTVLEPIRLELQLTDSGIAFLSGVSLALFYVFFGFPLSWLTDRSSRRNIIAASVIVWSAMTVCSGLARNYWQLLLSRLGVGIGEAGGTPGANSIISDYFPCARRPMALTVFSLGAPIGAWIAQRGHVDLAPVILGAGVICWVAGFDLIYAIQDYEFDRREGVHSLVVRLGVTRSLRLAQGLHAAMFAALIAFGLTAKLGPIYYCSFPLVAAALIYEHRSARNLDVAGINRAFFQSNAFVSAVFLIAVCVDRLV